MKIEKISEFDFQNEKCLKLTFGNFPSMFGKLVGLGEKILISWKSELIQPYIQKQNNILFIGIDNKFAIYNLVEGIILALFPLSSNFLSVLIREKEVIIISELEIIILNQEDYSILRHLHLPDVVEDYLENSKGVKIICMDETVVDVVC